MKELHLDVLSDLTQLSRLADLLAETNEPANVLISGQPGTGKTRIVQTYIEQSAKQVKRTIIIDPDNEYTSFAKSLGGSTEEFTNDNILSVAQHPNWKHVEQKVFMDWALHLSRSFPEGLVINWTTKSRVGFEPWNVLGLMLIVIQKELAHTIVVDEGSMLMQEPYLTPLLNLSQYATQMGIHVIVIGQAAHAKRLGEMHRSKMDEAFSLHLQMGRI